MKNINTVFDDDEFEALIKTKGNKSWHDFIMGLLLDSNEDFNDTSVPYKYLAKETEPENVD